jgi:hypothetical protein
VDREYLRDHNRADCELYAFADSLLERRLAASGEAAAGLAGGARKG